jgi:cytochrome c-type biogenesis protein
MSALTLSAIAATLGLLSFFEPCTIATHTLFSVRVHTKPRAARILDLATLWMTRTLLVVSLLLLAVMFVPAPAWGGYAPSLILAVMASVYIVSRFVYVPVPHLALWRLLPSAEVLPPAVKLALTLPACTLPLFLIVAALAVTFDSAPHAAAAGLLFASLFTLPTAVVAMTGLTRRLQHLLEASAATTSYLTAALLYGASVYLLAR